MTCPFLDAPCIVDPLNMHLHQSCTSNELNTVRCIERSLQHSSDGDNPRASMKVVAGMHRPLIHGCLRRCRGSCMRAWQLEDGGR